MQLPFASRNQDNALGHVIRAAAAAAGVNEFQMATIASHFIDALVDQVARGEPVTLPGFGMFVAWRWQPKRNPEAAAVVLPRFMAAQGFKQQVATSCLVGNADTQRAENYRRRHSTRIDRPKTSDRTFTAQRAFRDRIAAQADKALQSRVVDRTG